MGFKKDLTRPPGSEVLAQQATGPYRPADLPIRRSAALVGLHHVYERVA